MIEVAVPPTWAERAKTAASHSMSVDGRVFDQSSGRQTGMERRIAGYMGEAAWAAFLGLDLQVSLTWDRGTDLTTPVGTVQVKSHTRAYADPLLYHRRGHPITTDIAALAVCVGGSPTVRLYGWCLREDWLAWREPRMIGSTMYDAVPASRLMAPGVLRQWIANEVAA